MLWRADGKTAAEGYSRLPVESRTSVWPLDHSRVAMVSSQGLQLSDLKSDAPPISLIGPSTNILGPFGTNIVAEWNGTNQVLLREMRGTDFIPVGAITVESGLRPMSMDYNPKHQLLAWTDSSSSNSVHVASLAEPGRRRELKSNVAVTNVVRFSDDGDHLLALTGSGDAWHVWEVGSGRIVVSAQESLRHWVWAAGRRILVAGISTPGGYEIAFYGLDHPGRTAQWVPGRDALWSLARSPDGADERDVQLLIGLIPPD